MIQTMLPRFAFKQGKLMPANMSSMLSNLSLPNLFGETIVTNKVLPFGFSSLEHPSPER